MLTWWLSMIVKKCEGQSRLHLTYPEQWNNIVMNESGFIKPEPDRETYGDWWHIILAGIIKAGICKDFREANSCMSAMRHEIRV